MNEPVMDRWTAVKRIHQSALDKDPSERAAFVDESCGDDETLRREVQSLLTYATDAESFLERPPVPLPERPRALFIGALERVKGLDALLAVWESAAARVPGTTIIRVTEGW